MIAAVQKERDFIFKRFSDKTRRELEVLLCHDWTIDSFCMSSRQNKTFNPDIQFISGITAFDELDPDARRARTSRRIRGELPHEDTKLSRWLGEL